MTITVFSVIKIKSLSYINDNLLFTWRQRYRHLVDVPADDTGGNPIITDEDWICPYISRRKITLKLATLAGDDTLVANDIPARCVDASRYIAKRLNFDYNIDMSYSIDFRRKVLFVREKERLSIRETAKRFHIGSASV